MGLFGGFKAKFRGNKETKQKPERVVILRYQAHSEFDPNDFKPVVYPRRPTTRPTILPNNATGDNIQTATNREQSSDSGIANIPQEHNHKNGDIKKRPDKKPLPLNYLKPILKTSDTSTKASEVDNSEPSQGAESTQTSVRGSPKASKIDSKDKLDSHGDQEDFKVNVVHHSSITESPSSEDDDQEGGEYVSLEYSSQAASIFFGDEGSPTFSRPRRVRLRDDGSEDKKKNGEAEC